MDREHIELMYTAQVYELKKKQFFYLASQPKRKLLKINANNANVEHRALQIVAFQLNAKICMDKSKESQTNNERLSFKLGVPRWANADRKVMFCRYFSQCNCHDFYRILKELFLSCFSTWIYLFEFILKRMTRLKKRTV